MILCTGHTGQLAQALVEVGGHDVVAKGRPDLDLTMPETLEHALDRFTPGVVINTAAYTAVDKAESEREEAFALNGAGAGALADACAKRDIPFIHISTDYVFDGTKFSPYTTDDMVSPVNAYGESKLAGENAVLVAGGQSVIVRTAWVHGPHASNFTKAMIGLLSTRDEVSVVTDQLGSPTFTVHLAEQLIALAKRLSGGDQNTPSILHLAGDCYASRMEWVEQIASTLKARGYKVADIKGVTSDAFPTPAKRPPDSRLDTSKAAKLGLALPDWRQGVTACVERWIEKT